MNVNDIKAALRHRYSNFDYELTESYIFREDWESDFFCISKTGYAYEIEIKLSRSDYKADFKKPKHKLFQNLQNPFYIENRGESQHWIGHTRDERGEYQSIYAPCARIKIIDNSKVLCPNRFYYAVPAGLIESSEVPEYAGLIYVTSKWDHKIVKEAPYLHKRKLELTSILLSRFYHECVRQRQIIRYQQSKHENEAKL